MLSANRKGVILVTILMAFLLSIMPLPLSADAFRPDWLLIVIVYWSLALPNRVNVISAWVVGFMLDVMLGSVLGIHAAALAIVVFISAVNFQKIRNFSLWQQALIIGVLASLYHLVVFWLQRVMDAVLFSPSYLYPVLTTMLVWPWAFLILRKIRRQFKVS
jgi:rod shape-determining protein MreD